MHEISIYLAKEPQSTKLYSLEKSHSSDVSYGVPPTIQFIQSRNNDIKVRSQQILHSIKQTIGRGKERLNNVF